MSTEQDTQLRQRANRRLAEFLRHPGYEVIPLQGAEESVIEHVPKDISLTVTASPGKETWATVELAERLAGHGFGEKAPYATYIISQICFDPEVISDWARRVWARGVKLPIRVGMPGHVNRQRLVRISASIGVGESARFLRRQRNWLLKMFLPGGYSPDRLIEGLKPGFADPESNIRGLHIYTFNEVETTEAWRREMLERAETST